MPLSQSTPTASAVIANALAVAACVLVIALAFVPFKLTEFPRFGLYVPLIIFGTVGAGVSSVALWVPFYGSQAELTTAYQAKASLYDTAYNLALVVLIVGGVVVASLLTAGVRIISARDGSQSVIGWSVVILALVVGAASWHTFYLWRAYGAWQQGGLPPMPLWQQIGVWAAPLLAMGFALRHLRAPQAGTRKQ
ncbi:MAG TPA: hypothetical protein VLA88_01230 [Candidatus Saccharimonadales bacterium]|nr:hypothetical protein [Candidatus Saccharimonadales bacterium]